MLSTTWRKRSEAALNGETDICRSATTTFRLLMYGLKVTVQLQNTTLIAVVVQVCEESSKVVAVVAVLIRAWPKKKPTVPYVHGQSVPKLYHSCLKLAWDLRTGSYSTLAVDELEEINQNDHLRCETIASAQREPLLSVLFCFAGKRSSGDERAT